MMSIVVIEHDDAVAGLLPPVVSRLPGTNKCRYCVCVKRTGSCDKIHKAIIESRHTGLDCDRGARVYRDIDLEPKIIPYVELVGGAV